MVIQFHPKVWRHKVVNKYIPPDYADDINEGIDFAQYGIAVYRPRINWEEGKRTDLLTFDDSKYIEEIRKNIRTSSKFTPEVRECVI